TDDIICLQPEDIDPEKAYGSYSNVEISDRTISKTEYDESTLGKRLAADYEEMGYSPHRISVPDDAWIGGIPDGGPSGLKDAEIIVDIGGKDAGVLVGVGIDTKDQKVYDLKLSPEDEAAIIGIAKEGLIGNRYSKVDGEVLLQQIQKALTDPNAKCMM
ncbi:MAG: hypothetical protein KDD76_01870, partial [Rickettsiales bacterium]|nr:hypothetical protein [Rickettsiales bacterium]